MDIDEQFIGHCFQQQQQQPDCEDVTCKRCQARSQDLKQFSTTSNSTDSYLHAREPKDLSPGHPKCRTTEVKKTPTEALNSLLLRAGDVEHNPGPTQPCYVCSGAATTKGLECVRCGTRCHNKCSSLTTYEAVRDQ